MQCPLKVVAFLFVAACSVPSVARAGANLVVNGDFETTSMTTPFQIGYGSTTTVAGVTTVTNPNTVSGWTNTVSGLQVGYSFIFGAGNATSTGQNGPVTLYTSANGGTGGNASLNSPTGGNIVAAATGYQTTALTQSVSGLVAGSVYQLSFFWAGAQQTGSAAATTEGWSVSFGTQSQGTGTVTTTAQGFSAWRPTTMLFTASATTQTLSFLATGTTSGQSAFALLDGVSLTSVPEPWSIVPFGAGLAALGVLPHRLRRLRPVAA